MKPALRFNIHCSRLATLSLCLAMAMASLGLSGCNQYDPTKLTPKQMADEIVQTWKPEGVVSAEMKVVPDGYEGTAKMEGGETLNVKATSDPASKSVRIVGTGDRGSNFEYTLKTEKVSRF